MLKAKLVRKIHYYSSKDLMTPLMQLISYRDVLIIHHLDDLHV